MLELRQFRQFVAVAEEMSFRRAAARLHMAQPPLTAAIRHMEQILGVRLLERGNRITRLTEAGTAFLEEARRTLAQAERAATAAQRAGAGLTGSLRVGFVASAANHLLPRLLRTYRAQHPDVALELREATTSQQVADLRADRIDVGLIVPPLIDPSGLSAELLLQDELVAALPEGHVLVDREPLDLADMADEDWVLFPARQGPGFHGRILAACAAAGFSPRVVQEATQMETIAALVAGGLGVALVPASLAIRPGIAFRTISGPGTPVGYDLTTVWRTNDRAPTVSQFMRCAIATQR